MPRYFVHDGSNSRRSVEDTLCEFLLDEDVPSRVASFLSAMVAELHEKGVLSDDFVNRRAPWRYSLEELS